MKTLLRFLALAFLSFATLGAAEGASAQPVQVEIVASHTAAVAGQTVDVGLAFHLQEGWHTYWKNPGEAGAPIAVKWQLPAGVEVSDLQWPAPDIFETQGIQSIGYDKDFVLVAKVRVPADYSGETLTLKGRVTWVACEESCVPGSASVTTDLTIAKEAVEGAALPILTQAKSAMPVSDPSLKIVQKGKEAFVKLGEQELVAKNALFVPEASGGKASDLAQASPSKGVVKFEDKSFAVEASAFSQETSTTTSVFLWALLAAFAGGAILNLMPCVFPVLSIKVLGIFEIAKDNAALRLGHGLSYLAGVLVSFLSLSSLLLVLKATGQQVGWGFQLQEPLFVAFLAALLFVMGLNLFGLFEMGTSLSSLAQDNRKAKLTSSFLSGILATLVATPCTGPLLGSTLGLASSLPAVQSLTLFGTMGLGMAAPFVLLLLCPPLLNRLPRPGLWMERLKQAMGFLMMASVLWLLWVFEAQTGFVAVLWLLAGFILLAIATWVYGSWGGVDKSSRVRKTAWTIALALILSSGGLVSWQVQQPVAINQEQVVTDSRWQPYSKERLQTLLAEGKKVFIDVTAKWCLICQANKAVLHSDAVEKAFDDKEVVTLIADWTKGDPEITELLQQNQRSGVPFYVYYDGNKSPKALAETLTTGQVLDALN